MACVHKNFLIDQSVDEEVKKCFDRMVELQMKRLEKTSPRLDNEMRRKVAIRIVLEKKEVYKTLQKFDAAKKKQKLQTSEKKTEHKKKKKSKSLLKRCLVKSHQLKLKQQKENKEC
nr:PREDICTED: uncharacterized protein LOC107398238 [Tribolium castaneum]|eukprot:XP_015837109.1 PREDICTED: uncharacterized protein LOC107398238 [Tribolium castaneum]